jgi:hypothetical protein
VRLEYGIIRFLIAFKIHNCVDFIEKAFFSGNGIILLSTLPGDFSMDKMNNSRLLLR